MSWWRRLSRSELVLRLLSLLLAVVLWFLAADQRPGGLAPQQERLTVPLEVRGVPEGLEASGAPERVELVVRAFRRPAADGLRAYVDVGGLGPGRHLVPVQAQAPGFVVVGVEPARVSVQLERLVRRQLPVRLAVVGLPPGQVLQVAELSPAQATLSGAEGQVSRVAAVVASLDVAAAPNPRTALPGPVAVGSAQGQGVAAAGSPAQRWQLPLRAVDRTGAPVPSVKVEPQWATVQVAWGPAASAHGTAEPERARVAASTAPPG